MFGVLNSEPLNGLFLLDPFWYAVVQRGKLRQPSAELFLDQFGTEWNYRTPASARKYGGASRDRTDDLIVANDALSQLSYSPIGWQVRFRF